MPEVDMIQIRGKTGAIKSKNELNLIQEEKEKAIESMRQ